jgi:hypothetical protein
MFKSMPLDKLFKLFRAFPHFLQANAGEGNERNGKDLVVAVAHYS